jgi:hypothetical protein
VRGLPVKTHADIRDDIDAVTLLLAKLDLLVMAASMRNLIETTKSVRVAKSVNIQTSEIFISGGPPFFRDTKKTITVYQCLSRILHAHDLGIFRDVTDYYTMISVNVTDYFNRIEAFRREGGDSSRYEEPLVGMVTEKEGVTMVRLQYALTAVCEVLGKLSDALSEKKIFLQRGYR